MKLLNDDYKADMRDTAMEDLRAFAETVENQKGSVKRAVIEAYNTLAEGLEELVLATPEYLRFAGVIQNETSESLIREWKEASAARAPATGRTCPGLLGTFSIRVPYPRYL